MGFFTSLITNALKDHALKELGLKPKYINATFEEAVKLILGEIFEISEKSVPVIYKDLEPTYGESVSFKSPQAEKKATFDLALAVISYELIFIREIYKDTQCSDDPPKFRRLFFKMLEEGEDGKYAKEELETYLSFYEDYVNRDRAFKDMPFLSPDFTVQINEVVKRLIYKLYGNKITIDDRKLTGIDELTLVDYFRIAILKAGGRWEKIFRGYALRE